MSIILNNKDGVLLKTAGKYCPEDIIVKPNLQTKTATANGDISPDVGYCGLEKVTVNVPATPTQEKTITITENGTQEVTPDSGKALSKVTVTTNVPSGSNLNVHYGDTAPEDTSKLWIKAEEPNNISFPAFLTPEQIVESITDIGAILPASRNNIAAAAVGTKIYLFGGQEPNSHNYSSAIWVFDTTNNTIQTLSATLARGASNIAAAAVGTKIYLFGGYYEYWTGYGYDWETLNTIQVFDTTNNTIQTLSTSVRSGYNKSIAVVGTKIYLFDSPTIQVFDTINDTIQTLSATLANSKGVAAAAVSTKIYLFGGYDGSNALNTIRLFDTTNNTIQTLSATLVKASNYLSTAVAGTKIYLFTAPTMQVFDATSDTIQTLSVAINATNVAVTVGINSYLFYSVTRDINKFTVDIPLMTNDILVEQGTTRTFKVLKSPTEVEVAVKNVYTGDDNLAKFIDAYLYDGTNWVNINTSVITLSKLYSPIISISGKTLTITNDSRNGSKVTNYSVYNGSTLLTTIDATTLDLTTVITTSGVYNISVIATGTGYTDSDSSNIVEYNYTVYNITTNLTNITANTSNPTTVSTIASSTLIFTANTGYNLPDNVTVTGAEFTWTKSSGTLVLSNPTGNVSVTIAGVAISRTITATLTNVTAASGNATTIATGETKTLTYTAAEGYTLPDTVTVTGATGVWDKNSGTLTLSNPTANVTFTITGVKAASGYSVTLRNGDVGGAFTYYINEDAGVELSAYDSRLPLTLNNVYKIRLQCTFQSFYLSNTTGSLIGHENDIFSNSNYVSITEDSSADVYTDQ